MIRPSSSQKSTLTTSSPRCAPALSALDFVGRDPSSNAIVVAHEGTNAQDPFSVAIDAQFIRADINTTLFPNAPSGVEVHDGFQKTFTFTPVGRRDLQDPEWQTSPAVYERALISGTPKCPI